MAKVELDNNKKVLKRAKPKGKMLCKFNKKQLS
jgi:hypothetical protein